MKLPIWTQRLPSTVTSRRDFRHDQVFMFEEKRGKKFKGYFRALSQCRKQLKPRCRKPRRQSGKARWTVHATALSARNRRMRKLDTVQTHPKPKNTTANLNCTYSIAAIANMMDVEWNQFNIAVISDLPGQIGSGALPPCAHSTAQAGSQRTISAWRVWFQHSIPGKAKNNLGIRQ